VTSGPIIPLERQLLFVQRQAALVLLVSAFPLSKRRRLEVSGIFCNALTGGFPSGLLVAPPSRRGFLTDRCVRPRCHPCLEDTRDSAVPEAFPARTVFFCLLLVDSPCV